MTPIQQLMLGAGGAAKKTYLDDVFSTQVYRGNGSYPRSINSGVNFSEGGMVWMKNRGQPYGHQILDTVRGLTKALEPNGNSAEEDGMYAKLNSWNNNGYTMIAPSSTDTQNVNNHKIANWNFRKAPGFFTIKQYSGSGSAQTLTHDLGSVPGLILIKCSSHGSQDWAVGHRSLDYDANDYLILNSSAATAQASSIFGGVAPTSTTFRVGNSGKTNETGKTYIAYLFGGGESPAANAHSIELYGTDDGIKTSDSSDYNFGTGDFTVEFWIKFHTLTSGGIYQTADNRKSGYSGTPFCNYVDTNTYKFWADGSDRIVGKELNINTWYHIANVRHSGTTTLYIDGESQGTYSDTNNYASDRLVFGLHGPNEVHFDVDGEYSNIRIIKGTAAYTSNFRVPTAPLTNITNTKFLGANGSSATSTTVGTAVAIGDVIARTDSPFDDPAGFVFGENEDQGIIKCGSYGGSGTAGNEINLGWEPQIVMIKNTSHGDAWSNWFMYDSMRGVVTGDVENYIMANKTTAEEAYNSSTIDFTSTGFTIQDTGDAHNGSDDYFVFLAIRRSDGYCGKPAEAGTDVFAMDTGNNSYPSFTSNFPVDFGVLRQPATSENWWNGARLMGEHALRFNGNEAEIDDANITFDRNEGWYGGGGTNKNSNYQSWMWKRHAGFDVVSVKGAAGGKIVPHSLGRVPEMYWVKRRNGSTGNWAVYNKYLNGGTNPEQWGFDLNNNYAQSDQNGFFNDTAPNETHFSLGLWTSTGTSTTSDYLILLFASVDGISKLGSYSGSGSSGNAQNIGFQPRLLITKRIDSTGDWNLFDTVGGISNSGADGYMQLNTTQQRYNQDYISISSTGFSFSDGSNDTNGSGASYIYYAHA